MVIRARAPLRLGLAGGGTDIASYADVHGGLVLNATIGRYAYAVIRILEEPRIALVANDRQEREEADPDHPPATEQLAERELADDDDHRATR